MWKLKLKGWKRLLHTNEKEKVAGVAIIIPDNTDFDVKTLKRDDKGYHIKIKESIQREKIMIININAPNSKVAAWNKY